MSRQKIGYFIGLMTGTSLDGVDCVVYDFNNNKLIASNWTSYSQALKQQLKNITKQTTLKNIVDLDMQITDILINCILNLLKKENIKQNQIIAIGSHGQTIYHLPQKYSWQLGSGAKIANKTGITTINNFRENDIIAGGEGAPLTPKYHKYLLKNDGIIINLGGITNITIVKNNKIIGFDSGPANCLIDNYMAKHKNLDFDKDGLFARSGFIIKSLLKQMLADEYFSKKLPKSTGVEYFNLIWLDKFLNGKENPANIVCTLTELTALSISKELQTQTMSKIYLSGGGVFNLFLVERLKILNPKIEILTTNNLGLHPNFIEAVAFAYFAKLNLENKTINIPSVTGAKKAVILGTKYSG